MNTSANAATWIERLAREPAVPFGANLRKHFAAGRITRLCDCGCESFDVFVPPSAQLEPLCAPASRGGMFFEVGFESSLGYPIACLLFVDERGNLSGVDVTSGAGNHLPLNGPYTIGGVAYVA